MLARKAYFFVTVPSRARKGSFALCVVRAEPRALCVDTVGWPESEAAAAAPPTRSSSTWSTNAQHHALLLFRGPGGRSWNRASALIQFRDGGADLMCCTRGLARGTSIGVRAGLHFTGRKRKKIEVRDVMTQVVAGWPEADWLRLKDFELDVDRGPVSCARCRRRGPPARVGGGRGLTNMGISLRPPVIPRSQFESRAGALGPRVEGPKTPFVLLEHALLPLSLTHWLSDSRRAPRFGHHGDDSNARHSRIALEFSKRISKFDCPPQALR